MLDYATIIKQSVTMPQILSLYGFSNQVGHRIPCPIHNGEKRNLAFQNDRFKCYVCGASGTVIDFVMQLYGMDFQTACKKLDTDFHLGLNVGGKLNAEKQAEAERVCAERRAAKRRHDAERKRLYDAYHKALDEWCALDRAIRDEAPQTPWDDVSMHYAECLKRITVVGAAVDELEINLWEFEHCG